MVNVPSVSAHLQVLQLRRYFFIKYNQTCISVTLICMYMYEIHKMDFKIMCNHLEANFGWGGGGAELLCYFTVSTYSVT